MTSAGHWLITGFGSANPLSRDRTWRARWRCKVQRSAPHPGALLLGEVEVHALAGRLQIVALDVVHPGLPQGRHHDGAVDVGYYGQLALVVQGGDHFLELFDYRRITQIPAEGLVDLHVVHRQVLEYRVGVERAAEVAQGDPCVE